MRLCITSGPRYPRCGSIVSHGGGDRPPSAAERADPDSEETHLSHHRDGYTPTQEDRLRKIHQRLIEARRELDALIGDAYLRPRASIVPVHFLDLASAVEKLRWAEKEWRELDKELAASTGPETTAEAEGLEEDDEEAEDAEAELIQTS